MSACVFLPALAGSWLTVVNQCVVQAKVSRMAEVQKQVDGRAAADAARAEMEVKVRRYRRGCAVADQRLLGVR